MSKNIFWTWRCTQQGGNRSEMCYVKTCWWLVGVVPGKGIGRPSHLGFEGCQQVVVELEHQPSHMEGFFIKVKGEKGIWDVGLIKCKADEWIQVVKKVVETEVAGGNMGQDLICPALWWYLKLNMSGKRLKNYNLPLTLDSLDWDMLRHCPKEVLTLSHGSGSYDAFICKLTPYLLYW